MHTTEHITDRDLVAFPHASRMDGSECALLTGILSCIKFTHRSERQGRLKKANIEYVLLAGSSLFLCEPVC